MSFLRRKKDEDEAPPPPSPIQEDVSAQQYALKLNYLAKSSDGLRMQPDPPAAAAARHRRAAAPTPRWR